MDSMYTTEHSHVAVIDPARLRYFAGLTGEETAAVLGVSAKTVDRHWVYARAWLRREIAGPHESKENRADH